MQYILPILLGVVVLIVVVLVVAMLRARRGGVAKPEWADFFNQAKWQRFLMAVGEDLTSRQIPFHYQDGMIHAQLGEQHVQFGLGNLAQMCNHADERDWPEIIRQHYDNIIHINSESAADVADFEQVREQLFVRVASFDGVPRGDLAVARNDIPGTIAYLAMDLPTSVRSVTTGECEQWGKTPGQLYDIGLANVRAKSAYQEQRFPADDGIEFIGITGDDFFVASHTLLLHEHPEWLGEYGSLVIIPTRHTFMVYPVNDMEFVKAVQYLAIMATGMEREGPGSITAKLFWYQEGRFVDIPYTFDKKKMNVSPPEEFITLMSRIAEEKGEPAAAK